MNTLVQVMLGGGIGAGSRYLVGLALPFPWAVPAINVLGSLLIGLCYATLAPREHPALPFLTAGLMGGFTTFSAFSLDTFKLVEKGQVGLAAVYVAGSVGLSILACFGAIWWARS